MISVFYVITDFCTTGHFEEFDRSQFVRNLIKDYN
jgi:hypothetical protein